MANKNKKCKWCKQFVDAESGAQFPAGFFCSYSHAVEYANNKNRNTARIEQNRANKVRKAEKSTKTKVLRTRAKWYAILQTLVNQYVRWRDRDEPCCTCGTTNPKIKYDAGHFHTQKARPDIRFELTNIHKQCSRQCNFYGSGMRNEYEKFIALKYGADHIDFLNRIHAPLLEVFPNWQDIEIEIRRYRIMLRSEGIKPNI